ncbi:UNVERIFIED_CONTAM: hypothetical protein K2H54_045696 [Gekko kuhli]
MPLSKEIHQVVCLCFKGNKGRPAALKNKVELTPALQKKAKILALAATQLTLLPSRAMIAPTKPRNSKGAFITRYACRMEVWPRCGTCSCNIHLPPPHQLM